MKRVDAKKMLFTNCEVWTGEIGSAAVQEVLVDAGRIQKIAPKVAAQDRQDAVVIDLGGGTLLPGFIDGHSHLSFLETQTIVEFGFLPVEEHLIATMEHALRVFQAGFTSCIGAASAKPRLDIAVRDAINARRIVGPRLLAASPELTVTGGVADERLLHMYRESTGAIVDGPDEVRRYVRLMCREGVDIIKLNLSGAQGFAHAPAYATLMSEDEIKAAVEPARAMNCRLASHSHSAQAVKLSVKHGIEFIHHCTLADDEAIDLLDEHRDRVFMAPAIGNLCAMLFEAKDLGISTKMAQELNLKGQLESSVRVYSELRKRKLRVLVGGDYGFAWNPHGRNARDMEYFVSYFGYSPEEALRCATVNGALAMRRPDDLGRIREGYVADLVAFRGKPHLDITATRPENVMLVVKEGEPYGKLASQIGAAGARERIAA